MDSRDRDPTGRARNARPRDALGRPLPHGARGVDRIPEGVVRNPDEAVRHAQRLIDDGYPFHAHEVFEGVWKATSGERRELWQGLAQLAVGLTHVQRGNPKGAVTLLRRAADRLDRYAAEPPHGLDIAGLASHARALAERIERSGLGDAADGLQPRLRS
jgi:predicted metal-dependent hydrolase